MPSRRALARGSARILAGIIGVAVAVAALTAAVLLPLHGVRTTPPSVTVTPVPADQQRVCPGPLLELGAGSDPNGLSTAGSPAVVTTATTAVAQQRLSMPGVSGGASGPTVISTEARGSSQRPLVAGAQSQQVSTAGLAGLAAAACGEASADSWLVAGATALGDTSLVMLDNPTSVEAVVNLTVYSEDGELSAPGARGLVVRAHSQSVVPLAGMAPDAQATAVHVQATGGSVYATLQQSAVQGLSPQGVELVGPTAEPADRQVIAGMVVANVSAGAGSLPTVRLLAPGTGAVRATVTAVDESQPGVVVTQSVSLQGGVVREVSLTGTIGGSYTVTVAADRPVVAAARTVEAIAVAAGGTATQQAEAATQDFAWFVASSPLQGTELLAVPAGSAPTLHLTNPTDADARVALTDASGGSTSITVDAGHAVSVPVQAKGRYTLRGVAGLRASVSLTAAGASSSFALNPSGPLAQPIVVHPK